MTGWMRGGWMDEWMHGGGREGRKEIRKEGNA